MAKDYTVSSPNRKLSVVVSDDLQMTVYHQGKQIFAVSSQLVPSKGTVSFHRGNCQFLGRKLVRNDIVAPFYRQSSFQIEGNELDFSLGRSFGWQVRVYDEGIAYRFYTKNKNETIIVDEKADFSFPEDSKAWLAYSTNDEKPFAMAFQNFYDETKLCEAKDKYVFLPATIQSGDVKVTILESDLRSYPGMFLKVYKRDGSFCVLSAAFAKYPKRMDYYKWRGMSYVADTEDYIAKSIGARTYPWRVMAITENDTEMPVNNLVYTLATPNQIGDTSWIRPGKVAWDWWNDWNLKGVDFEADINTRTYQYYIDFAAKNHIPYVVLDEGWYDSSKGDIMNPIDAIDLQGLIDYGKQRGVSIVLWTVFNVLDEHLVEACEKYKAMGIKGWKIDFMDRNDQTAVEMAERLAKTCAKYQLFVDYHGYFAPTGMNRTYPNILNYEGVFGMEEARWAKRDTDMPRYDVTFPFIRMMAGPVDFTPGAMRNGTKHNWVECYQNPVSMGTRCHQLACYVVHDSPFTMLCDAPTNYEREQACVDIITSIPDTFDETRILQGYISSYIITARRSGSDWFIGGQTNWDEREVDFSFDFLRPGATYQATIVTDGINANHNAEDYRIEHQMVTANSRLKIKMASGGGFVIILKNAPSAANPFIPGYFADPTIRKFGDTYYLYATTDGTGNGYGPAQVWVSKDFVNWKNIVMNWPTTEVVWAPDVVQQPDGTYRYYYCEPCNINIGESTSPVGPWKNILGKNDAVMVPDRYVHNVITLDPQLFRDDDGSEYLYFTTWGIYKGFGCGVAKLNGKWVNHGKYKDARIWNENAPFPIAADEFFSEKRLIPNTELKDIFEAPFVFKRNGVYYFTYSSGSCHDHTYRVQYATSTVGPMGPFEYKGCILETNADQTVHGPGHHSILEQDGKYYIVYHRHNLPRSVHGFNRQVCIDEMKFDANGNILPVVPTHDAQGVSVFKSQTYKNLALGVKVTASSYYDEWFKPEYAIDDNNATLWKARNTNWGQGMHKDEWLQIDLGKPMKFNEVWTQFEYATFFYQYRIETSLDGKKWTLYADRTNNTIQGSPMIDKGTVKSQYIRITITDTQKNGHMPAIWNVKVWEQAPELPEITVGSNDGYPGMHQKDVEPPTRYASSATVDFNVASIATAKGAAKPFDITEIDQFKANKPIRVRVKDGRWAMFLNGTQRLVSEKPLADDFRYNAPYTISALVNQTKAGPVSTVVSLSTSHADLATSEFRLGTDPKTGIMNHNGSFESCGAPEAVKAAEGRWTLWTVTFDGWMERVYQNGELVHEQNNFLMVRPEGHITIGADGSGANNFMGYISQLNIAPQAMTAEEVKTYYESISKTTPVASLGDDDFEEVDPDSKFTLSPTMKPVFEHNNEIKLSDGNTAFNDDPLKNGATIYKEVEGDFVVMARVADIEGLQARDIKPYNDGGLLVSNGRGTYYQLGAFPLYNCGNMLTILSSEGRPQFPNYKGYDFDPILQFERRVNLLFARTSKDGQTWTNMPGSPIEVNDSKLSIGVYQTTYSDNTSWVKLRDFKIYQ